MDGWLEETKRCINQLIQKLSRRSGLTSISIVEELYFDRGCESTGLIECLDVCGHTGVNYLNSFQLDFSKKFERRHRADLKQEERTKN